MQKGIGQIPRYRTDDYDVALGSREWKGTRSGTTKIQNNCGCQRHQIHGCCRRRSDASELPTGEWQPGLRLPARRDLQREFGLSSPTIELGNADLCWPKDSFAPMDDWAHTSRMFHHVFPSSGWYFPGGRRRQTPGTSSGMLFSESHITGHQKAPSNGSRITTMRNAPLMEPAAMKIINGCLPTHWSVASRDWPL